LLLEISAKEISDLDPFRFVELANHLIGAECDKLGISPYKVLTSGEINVADEGIDARIDDSEKKGDERYIPSGLSVWQFKSGKASATPKKLEREVTKPGVLRALKARGQYVVAVGVNNPKTWPKQTKALQKAVRRKKFSQNQVRLITPQHLKQWASEHPSTLLLPYFNRALGNCILQEEWERIPRHRGAYVTDDQRKEFEKKIAAFVARRDAPVHLRLLGRLGVGKTRLVLESLRQKGTRERVIYAPDPDAVPPELFAWLKSKPVSSAILVIDECSRDELTSPLIQSEVCDGRVRLISIDTGEPFLTDISGNCLFLDVLDDKLMGKMLEDRFKSLSPEQISWIVRVSGGRPKLAVTCGEILAQRPDIDITKLTQSAEIHDILDLFLPDPKERRVMQGLSLLSRVGFEDEVKEESKTIAEFVKVDWLDFCEIVNQTSHRGLVEKKGRYRYVTPDLLASWLAADIWNARTEEVQQLLDKLPTTGSQDAFFERIKDLGTDEKTQAVIRSLLSERNFPSIEQLDNDKTSRILYMLALADPISTLDTLERLIVNATNTSLRQAVRGRRNLVNALDYIKWFGNAFFRAARLLLALAEAENEEYGNNATGIWGGLFRIHLGGTEVPAIDRLALIEEILASGTRARRELALKALGVVMSAHEVRGSGIEMYGPRPVPPEWHPRTYGEIWEVYRKTLQLVDRAMLDEDQAISQEAKKILLDSARTVIASGLADEIINRVENIKIHNDDEQRTFRQCVEEILRFESNKLKDDQRNRLIALEAKCAGTSYHDRIHRWIGQWSWGDWNIHEREGGLPPQGRIAELADEAFANPERLRAELDWLVSDKAVNVGYFGQRLGELDKNHIWLADLVTKTHGEARSPILLATYLGGRSTSGDEELVHHLLDQWSDSDKELADVVVLTTMNLQPSKQNVDRLLKLVQKNWIQTKDLAILVFSGWAEKLVLDIFRDFVACLLRDESQAPTEIILDLLNRRLKWAPQEITNLAPYAWQTLERESSAQGTMAQFYWGEVSKRILHVDPLKLVDIVLTLYKNEAVLFLQTDEPLKILAEATRLRPNEAWARVSEALLRQDRVSYRLLLGLRGWYVRLIQADELLAWASKHEPDGPRILASLTLPDDIPLNELTRKLLIQYGHDDRIGNSLFANLRSGAFTGSMTAWLRGKLETAEKWSEDPDPAVSNWAKNLANDLREEITQFQKREEEEDII
jgi:hypothetical protein